MIRNNFIDLSCDQLFIVLWTQKAPVRLSERRRAFIRCFLVYVGESATAARLGGFLWVVVLYVMPGRGPHPAAQRSPYIVRCSKGVLLAGASAAKEARL